jgi:hypothetical protein
MGDIISFKMWKNNIYFMIKNASSMKEYQFIDRLINQKDKEFDRLIDEQHQKDKELSNKDEKTFS